MWFKNLIIYQIVGGQDPWLTPAVFEQSLGECVLLDPHALSRRSSGWVPPTDDGRLLTQVGGQFLFALGVAERQLPAAVIKSELKKRIQLVADEQGFPVGRRQARELKQKISDELLPKALIKTRVTQAWIDTVGSRLIVNTSSPARADEVVSMLLSTHSGLQFRPIETKHSIAGAAAVWLKTGDAPGRFTLDDQLELQALDKSRSNVRYARCDISTPDIRARLSNMSVLKLGLNYADKIFFVLTETGSIRKVEFIGINEERPEGTDAPTAQEEFLGNFVLMAGEVGNLLTDLIEALGGYAEKIPA